MKISIRNRSESYRTNTNNLSAISKRASAKNYDMRYVLAIASLVLISFIQFANAEPIPYEEFIKWYQPKIDKATLERLNPIEQLDLGIYMLDTICFDGKIKVLKFSDHNLVACVNPQSAQKLVERGWGITKNESMFTGSSHGTECGNGLTISFKDKKPPVSSIIYKIRNVMMEFDEILLWQPITVVQETNDSIILGITGAYNLTEEIKLKDTIRKIPDVLDVKLEQGGCI